MGLHQDLSHPALAVQLEVGPVLHGVRIVGADGGDVRPAPDMLLQDLLEGEVRHEVAFRQNHVVLPNFLEIGPNTRESLHLAPEGHLAPGPLIGEGGQDLETAPLAGEVPALAAAQVVEEALVPAVEHHAHVLDPGVHQVGEDEVHAAVAPAEGQRRRRPLLRQFIELVALFIGENDAVQFPHFARSSPRLFSMIPAFTFRPGATSHSGARTARPQASGSQSSGAAPTRASAPTRQFSPRMA